MTIINGQFYVGIVDDVTGEGKMVPYSWDTEAIIGPPIMTIGVDIMDFAYILWMLSELDMLYKIDFANMSIM